MPHVMRLALTNLQKVNLQQKSKILIAEEVDFIQNVFGDNTNIEETIIKSESVTSSKSKSTTNKYNRNILMVLDSTLTGGFKFLFSDHEHELH